MESSKTVFSVVGIRPDFIRMAPTMRALDKEFDHKIVHTGQHYDANLSEVFFDELRIRTPDINLGIGGPGKSYYQQTAELDVKLTEYIKSFGKSVGAVIFLGDSNSVLSSVPLRKAGIPIVHIEAGMRSGDMRMLEEINRRVCDHVSNIRLCYHTNYRKKLEAEGLGTNSFVVGNTIVEALSEIRNAVCTKPKSNDHILVDIHRPENFMDFDRMKSIFKFIDMASIEMSLPVYMIGFKRTMEQLHSYNITIPGCTTVIPPMSYKEYVGMQYHARFILSDSGTVQEEAPLLYTPVLVPRDYTERPESYDNGCSHQLVMDESKWTEALKWVYAYRDISLGWLGHGNTSMHITHILKEFLK